MSSDRMYTQIEIEAAYEQLPASVKAVIEAINPDEIESDRGAGETLLRIFETRGGVWRWNDDKHLLGDGSEGKLSLCAALREAGIAYWGYDDGNSECSAEEIEWCPGLRGERTRNRTTGGQAVLTAAEFKAICEESNGAEWIVLRVRNHFAPLERYEEQVV